jgi:DnaK suppressor protein
MEKLPLCRTARTTSVNSETILQMDVIKIKDIRQDLFREQESLTKFVERSQLAAKEIKLEHTEDEGDLATISHDRDVLYNLHEGAFTRLQSIQAAIESIDRGQYGECVECKEDISDKRLEAVPWATKCIRCQEASETQLVSLGAAGAGSEDETEF